MSASRRFAGVVAVLLAPAWLAVSAEARDEAALPEILLSRQLLEASGLEPGDVASLATEPDGSDARRFRVVAEYEPVPDPMRLTARRYEARMHLPDLLALTGGPGDPLASESVDAINVELREPARASDFARQLTARLHGLAVTSTGQGGTNAETFLVLERFHVAIAVVTVIGSTAFLLALMIMRADERRETVGILRLVGLGKRRVLLDVLVEGLFIALAGAAFGVAFALATEDVVNRFFQWRYDTPLVFMRITAGIALRCVVVAVPLGVLAGLVASWTILRRDVVALLRR